MRKYFQFIFTLWLVSGLFACVPAAPATQEAEFTFEPTKSSEPYHSLSTRTGIEEIDKIIEAVASGDVKRLQPLIQFTNAKCTNKDGLGGPPKCRAGEAEGTPVDVLPFMGSEGNFLRRDELNGWQGIDMLGLYAVYEVSSEAYADENYPAGEHAILFIGKENQPAISLRVSEGRIVRVDYVFDPSPEVLKATLEREASKVLFAPPTP